ncbi:hypothetical protein [Chondromyces apiculatus]|uniref:Spermidine synthase n=1 Tax=Chondromyces apiculatus DSM 436 TaxID=1192034 RepID=A0A017TEK9_9BACT|nr:hypothetical protein [Chondromyces apiculatus]EYF07669.1 Hypothetical protein CAP_8170 [Chondromyces apiculatus DSM 436]
MQLSQRSGLLGGVALTAGATVLLEIVLTRLFSAIYGNHLAFLAISLSLFGVGLGGVLLYVAPSLARPPHLFARLAALAALASAGTLAAVIVLLYLKPIQDLAPRALLQIAAVYLVSSIPFVLGGIILAAAIRHAARDMARLYLVNLFAAAVGGVAALAALKVGAPRAGLLIAILFALGGVFFWLGARASGGLISPRERRGSGALVATFVLGSLVLLLGDLGAPWLKLPNLRFQALSRVEYQAWNEQALITVERLRSGAAWMRFDGTDSTPIFDAKTNPPAHTDELGYVLHKAAGPVLLIGALGGSPIRDALKAGQTDIHVSEINGDVVTRVLRDRYAGLTDHLLDRPEVHVAVADGRNYARRATFLFKSIVLSHAESRAATAVGALSLRETPLYTVEAFRDFLGRLTPDGTLVVTRSETELDRLLALSGAALHQSGAADPKAHLFACNHEQATTVLLKRSPLDRQEIQALRTYCRKNRFTESFSPDQARTDLRHRLVTPTEARAAAESAPTDLTPPSDDRPFFFYDVPPRRLFQVLRDVKLLKTEQNGLLTLATLFVVSAVLALLFLVLPVFLRRPARPLPPDRGPRVRALLFFPCLGAGFVLVEIALVQHFVLLLGHPVYALTAVLVILLFSAGIGSLLTAGIPAHLAARAASWRAQLLVLLLAAAALGLGRLLGWGLHLPFNARLALAAGILVPLGLLMGAQAPLGVKLVATRAPTLLPWCWGLNGVASVVAIAAGTFLALHFGYSAVLLLAALIYLAASALVPPPAEQVEAPPVRSTDDGEIVEDRLELLT